MSAIQVLELESFGDIRTAPARHLGDFACGASVL